MDLLESEEPPGLEDQSVSLVAQALRDPRAQQERRAARVRKVLQGQLAVMVSRAPLVYLAQLDLKDHPERMVTREKLVSRVRREAKATRANMVLRVQLVFRV